MKKIAAAVLGLMLSIPAFAGPPAQVSLGWSYDYTQPVNNTVISWNVYVGTNATAIVNWDTNTNQCRCYQYVIATGSTNLSCTVTGLVRGATYYFNVTPVTSTGLEGDYCNEVRAAVPTKPGKGNNLVIIGIQ
jgi:hypothetical protein